MMRRSLAARQRRRRLGDRRRAAIGAGWQSFTALLAPRDFSGDGHPDLLARTAEGALLMYRGNGAGGWITGTGEPIGSGWGSLST